MMLPNDFLEITINTFKSEESKFLDFLTHHSGREIEDIDLEKAFLDANAQYTPCLLSLNKAIAKRAYIFLVMHYLIINTFDLSYDIEDKSGDGGIARQIDFMYPTYRKKVDEVEKWQHVFDVLKSNPAIFALTSTLEGQRYLQLAMPCFRQLMIVQGKTFG